MTAQVQEHKSSPAAALELQAPKSSGALLARRNRTQMGLYAMAAATLFGAHHVSTSLESMELGVRVQEKHAAPDLAPHYLLVASTVRQVREGRFEPTTSAVKCRMCMAAAFCSHAGSAQS